MTNRLRGALAFQGNKKYSYFCYHRQFLKVNKQSVHPPLSNIQAELLKLFSVDIPEKNLKELKHVMARYLLEKARDKADAVWDKKEYTDEKLQEILNKK